MMFSNYLQIVVFVLSILKISTITCNDNGQITVWQERKVVHSKFATQGRSDRMEESPLDIEDVNGTGIYGIFDGHSGNFSAFYAAEKLAKSIETHLKKPNSNPFGQLSTEQMLWYVIHEMEGKLEGENNIGIPHDSGTTCLLVIAEKTTLTVANVGDSRCVMCNSHGVAFNLSTDHKPNNNNERKRIEIMGGEIKEFDGKLRVKGLTTTRTLGDTRIKTSEGGHGIIHTPDIFVYKLKDYQPRFMILASAGLWDVISNQDAVNIIKPCLNEKYFGANRLVAEAIRKGSMDNITVLIVRFFNGQYDLKGANGQPV